MGEGASDRDDRLLPLVALEDNRGDRSSTPVLLDLDRSAATQVHEPRWVSFPAAVGSTDDWGGAELHVGDEDLSDLTASSPSGAQQEHVCYAKGLDSYAYPEVPVDGDIEARPPACRYVVEPGTATPGGPERPVEPSVCDGDVAPVNGALPHGTPLSALLRA